MLPRWGKLQARRNQLVLLQRRASATPSAALTFTLITPALAALAARATRAARAASVTAQGV